MEELEGIGEIIVQKLKIEKKVTVKDMATYLNLSEDIVLDAVDELAEKGLVFQPEEGIIALV